MGVESNAIEVFFVKEAMLFLVPREILLKLNYFHLLPHGVSLSFTLRTWGRYLDQGILIVEFVNRGHM